MGSEAIPTLNYDTTNLGYFYPLGELVLEPLLVLTKSGKLTPWLAQSWQQVNPLTYVYHIRQGVKFSDGHELTAADVAFSLNFYNKTGSLDSYNFPPTLKSITATGKFTVTIKFSAPDDAWTVAPAGGQLGIFEQAFYEAHKSTFGQPGTGVMGTGPWQVTSFDPTNGAQLSVNPYYWGGKVPIKHISWSFFSTETSEALAFRAGAIDVAFPSDNKVFATTSGAALDAVSSTSTEGQFLMNVLDKPWSNLHVREAVAYALNRQDIIAAYGGYAQPVQTFIPAGDLDELASSSAVNAGLATVPTYAYDPAKAKQQLALAGYPHGGVPVTLAVYDFGADPNIAQVLQAELDAVGFKVTLDVQNTNAWTALFTGANRTAVLSGYSISGAISPDPGGAFSFEIGSNNATSGNWNGTNWGPPAVDATIAQGLAATTGAGRLQEYIKLLQAYGTNLPMIPLFLADATVAISSSYTWPSFNGFFYDDGPWGLGIKAKS